jgi:dsRNA-specific ribonuclease
MLCLNDYFYLSSLFHLLDLNPRYNQGQLSVLKSAITCNDTLAVIGLHCCLHTGLHLLLQHRLPAKQIEELESFVDHQNKNQHLFSLEKVSNLA